MSLQNLGNDLSQALLRPFKGLGRVAEKRSIWEGLALYVIISLLVVFFTARAVTLENLTYFLNSLKLPFSEQLAQVFLESLPVFSLILQLIFGPLLFLSWLAIVNFCAELFSGEGDANSLGAAFGFTTLPALLLVPAALLSQFFSFKLILITGAVSFFWSHILKIIALKEAHQLTFAHAFMAYLLPVVAFLIALFLFVLMSVAFLLPLVIQFLDSITMTF